MVETQHENLETHSCVSPGTTCFSHCGCSTAQKSHCANTLWPYVGGGEPPLKDLAGENTFKVCQLIWRQEDVGKGLSKR